MLKIFNISNFQKNYLITLNMENIFLGSKKIYKKFSNMGHLKYYIQFLVGNFFSNASVATFFL